MKLNADVRTRLLADMTLNFDPTGSTAEISVDGVWYEAAWIGSPTSSHGNWAQTMRTLTHFAGPDFDPTGLPVVDTVTLTDTRHTTRTRVITADGDVLVRDSSPIDIYTP
jgi:hypothetical protein